MITKELWSAVTKKPIPSHLKLFGHKDITAVVGDDMISINIYELAHICKVWAFKNGYEVSTRHDNIDSIDEDVKPSGKILYYNSYVNSNYIARCGTEPESIFKACEFILKNTTI